MARASTSLPRKTLNVLGYLILNRARPVTRDSIAFALFPDEDEDKARTSLRRNLSYLLSALPDGKQFVNADPSAWLGTRRTRARRRHRLRRCAFAREATRTR